MKITASRRQTDAKRPRQLLREGRLPGVVYGHRVAAHSLELDAHEFARLYARAGRSQLVDLVVEGGRPHKVLIKEVQLSPRRNTPIHVDFQQVSMREKLQVDVPITLAGESPAVTTGDGELLHVLHSLRVECLPGDIPEALTVDVSGLAELESGIRVSELALPTGVTAMADGDELVVKVQVRRDMAAALEAEVAAEAQESGAATAAGEEPGEEGASPKEEGAPEAG